MAEVELSKALKDLPNRVLNVSIDERNILFQNVINVLSNPGINSAIVRGICKVMATTITKYKDQHSQKLVLNLIEELLKNHHDLTVEHLLSVFKSISVKDLPNASPLKGAKIALVALDWTILIMKYAQTGSNVFKTEKDRLLEYQFTFYQSAKFSGNNRIYEAAKSLFFDLWTKNEFFDEYLSNLIEKEPSTCRLLVLMLLIQFDHEIKQSNLLESQKTTLINFFIKTIIASKIKPNANLIVASRPLLKDINEYEFSNKFYPPLQRAMLRNPEIIIFAVGLIVKEINLDFSPYAVQLGKNLINHLYSKDENCRSESVETLKCLSSKCQNPDTIRDLLENIFSVLGGSDGKITVIEYRINLFLGAGYLSFNNVKGDDNMNLLKKMVELFSKTLESEIQERIICHALEMFSWWSMKFTDKLSSEIICIFKKGMEMKTTTPAVRLSYLHWLLSALHNATLSEDANVTHTLLSIFDKAMQNQTQSHLIAEAACASCIILKIESENSNPILHNFWNTIIDLSKQPFFSDRFICAASPDTLCHVFLMAERLLTTKKDFLKGSQEPIFKAIIHCLISSHLKLRSFIKSLLTNIISDSDGVLYVKKLLIELKNHIEATKLDVREIDDEIYKSNYFVEAINDLCNFSNISCSDAQFLAPDLLILCNYPIIFKDEPNMWENILQSKFKLEPKLYISLNIKQIKENILENFIPKKSLENALSAIIRISPEVVLPVVLQKIYVNLSNPDIRSVTDDDYFTYLTPDGELYEKSILPNNEDLYTTVGLKRENKVYTYKEQLEELQLRRELDEKRRKEGKLKPPQLTAKQQEAIKNQIEKEKQIKIRLHYLEENILSAIALIEAACSGNSEHLSYHFCKLLPSILNILQSPLAAGKLSDLYYFLNTTCFSKSLTDLGNKIAICTIRLEKPHCVLREVWIKQELNEAIVEAFSILSKYTLLNSGIENINENNIMTTSAFSYAFEFIKRALHQPFIYNNQDILLSGIQFIEVHAQIYFNSQTDTKYLPREEMLRLLIRFIRCHTGRVQSQSVIALLEVAKLSSGEKYCAIAECKEIELLLESLHDKVEALRDAALRSLLRMINSLKFYKNNNNILCSYMTRVLWIAKFDISSENRVLGNELWDLLELPLPKVEDILSEVTNKELCIQKASSKALVPLIEGDVGLITDILQQLIALYSEKLIKIPAKLDQFDREIEPAVDQWQPRRGVAIAIFEIAQFFTIAEVNYVMEFMVSFGLGDSEEVVHKEMLASALAIVDKHGKNNILTLIPVFEEFLDKAPKSQSYDNIRQAVVILMGSVARHLEKDDKRIEPIVRRLLTALTTPSQQVQEAVANCLPHLMPAVKDEAPALVKKLLQQLIKSDKYGERRGAAYGISGIVKGLGILSLKQLDIMAKLTTYIQEKKNYKSREGALFAFEVLCTNLGRLFEPYIVHVLPHLLQCFGDSSVYVRQAADETAKVVMRKLSAHGVKLVLPSLLDALDEDSWRTKTASVELLGAMAFCAPKQLSSCLPSIVPKLIEVLGDSHTKVQEAGADALKVIGSVIKNPEIQAIVPVLLQALEDPSKNTSNCLNCLLQTKFVHFIDAPSLALIMPVVQRAFMDRSTETRKMAAQIIGNMYSLTDQKDLTPYLPNIIPGLKTSLLDPVPEVRAVSARALGAMVRGMGETSFEDLLPWLMQTLTSEASSVDRSGAAQGLSEVVGGLGVEKLHKLMPEIIATAERTDIAPHVKDGYIMMFIYMPGAFPEEFTPYIGQIINPILRALADENEYVRDTALKAGQRIVNLYAESAVTLLLPELEKGLFDDNWRIRYSSVQLLGDLLYRISGVSGKMTTETASEDDNFGTEQSHSAIIRFLGEDRRNRVLSGLYMGRSDVSLMVRQAALHVWKVVVTNTPRTLREILPTLFSLLLGCLASTSYDKRQVAARTLGDLVRKLGERVLPEIIPILEKGLNSEHADQRQGVCIGLSEIMASTSKEMVLTFVNSLVPTVRKALSDPLPEVREAAAKTFESLHSTVGSRALDDILPSMLEGLSDPDEDVAENTLDGLRQVMSIKSRVVLPYLVPQLTSNPVNTKALSILVSVAGDALTKYLPRILSSLLQALSNAQGTPNELQELEYCQTVILSVTDEVGIRTIMDTLLASAKSDCIETKKSVSSLLCAFCMHSRGDYFQYVPQLLRCLLRLMAESDRDILQRSWDALNAVVKNLDSSQQIAHVSDVRQAVRFAASDLNGLELPGFCLPKGITPLLPVFREAILNGLPEEKENAAQGLGEIISLTNAQSLQPSVVHITGPLIRILGDRFNAGVKGAVLETLAVLLKKVGVMLKQFLPQLQTTFLKSLHDQNRNVRMKAGYALSELVKIHTRADPLFNEIHNGIKNIDDSGIRETMLHALRSLITPAGDKMSDPIRKQIYTTLLGMLGHHEEVTRSCVGGCLGAIVKYLSIDQIDDLFINHLLVTDTEEGPLKHGRTVALFVALKECPNFILKENLEEKILAQISIFITSEKVPIACNGVRAITYLMEYKMLIKNKPPHSIIIAFARAMNHSSNDVKQIVAKSCSHLAKSLSADKIPLEVLKYLVPMLVNGTKEKNGYVKSNSELALMSILRLSEDEAVYKKLGHILEPGANDSLSEVVNKIFRKAVVMTPGKEDELDDSILS